MWKGLYLRRRNDLNKVILMGRLTRDPEIRYSKGAEPVCVARYDLAVNRRYKRQGEPDADFIPCVAIGKQGTFAERYLRKGILICVTGRIQIKSWDDKNTGQKRWSTEVVAEEHYFAESKKDSPPPVQIFEAAPEGFAAIANGEDIGDDDLPF